MKTTSKGKATDSEVEDNPSNDNNKILMDGWSEHPLMYFKLENVWCRSYIGAYTLTERGNIINMIDIISRWMMW